MRTPPEYVMRLLERRIREDLVNRKTAAFPKGDPRKPDLPKRSEYTGALKWLKAVRERMGENVVFALDEALMCHGSFGGRSDEFLVRGYCGVGRQRVPQDQRRGGSGLSLKGFHL